MSLKQHVDWPSSAKSNKINMFSFKLFDPTWLLRRPSGSWDHLALEEDLGLSVL